MSALAKRMKNLSWYDPDSVSIGDIKTGRVKNGKPNKHIDAEKTVKHRTTTSKEDKASVEHYQNASHEINGTLRQGDKPSANHDKVVGSLDNLTNEHETSKPVSVYRGVHHKFRELPVGTEIHDKGYTGTSTKRHVAERFGIGPIEEHKGKTVSHNTIAHIRLPAGSKGAYLPNHTPNSKFAQEHEHLMPRGSNFRVTGHSHTIEQDEDNPDHYHHQHVVHMEHIP